MALYICRDCNADFKQLVQIRRHIKREHPERIRGDYRGVLVYCLVDIAPGPGPGYTRAALELGGNQENVMGSNR